MGRSQDPCCPALFSCFGDPGLWGPQTPLIPRDVALVPTPGLHPQGNPGPPPAVLAAISGSQAPSPFLGEQIHRLANTGISPRPVICVLFFVLPLKDFSSYCLASISLPSSPLLGVSWGGKGFPHKPSVPLWSSAGAFITSAPLCSLYPPGQPHLHVHRSDLPDRQGWSRAF